MTADQSQEIPRPKTSLLNAAKAEMKLMARAGAGLGEAFEARLQDSTDPIGQYWGAAHYKGKWLAKKTLEAAYNAFIEEGKAARGSVRTILTLARYAPWQSQSDRKYLVGMMEIATSRETGEFACSERTASQFTTLERKANRKAMRQAEQRGWITVKKCKTTQTIMNEARKSVRGGSVNIEELGEKESRTLNGSSFFIIHFEKIKQDLLASLTTEAMDLLRIPYVNKDGAIVQLNTKVSLEAVHRQMELDDAALRKIDPTTYTSLESMDSLFNGEVLDNSTCTGVSTGVNFALHGFAHGAGLNQQVFELVHLHGLGASAISKMVSMSLRTAQLACSSLRKVREKAASMVEKVTETIEKLEKRHFWYRQERRAARFQRLKKVPTKFIREKRAKRSRAVKESGPIFKLIPEEPCIDLSAMAA